MSLPVRRFWGLTFARLAVAFVVTLGVCASAQAERLALVVGNAAYNSAPVLKNPVNDATAVADALKRLGFGVTLLTDAGGDDLWKQMDAFAAKADTAESVVFYYSGHAFQMSGVNYLVPVNAKLSTREGAKKEAWSLDAIIARLQSRSRQTLIFLDACRNDPLPSTVRGSGAAADGLARVQAGAGTFVAFATAPGEVTADGVGDSANSPFTSALLSHLEEPGISISDMMIEVRNDVENATLRKQVPWDQSSLREQFFFVPQADASKQVLSEADYELLAQLSPDDRKKFLDLLKQSGFDEASLSTAEAAIAVSEANLEQVASQTTVIGAPVTSDPVSTEPASAAAPDTQVASAETSDQSAGLGGLEVVQSAVTIGAATEASGQVADQSENGPIRLAALNWDTRDIAINEVTIQRMRVTGRQLQANNDSDRAVMAAIDPSLLQTDTPISIAPADLARGIQSELKRLGCYQIAVDGDWGNGSRTALTSYYLAKRQIPDSLEPSDALYAALTTEDTVVCKARVAKSAVKTGVRTVAAEPVAVSTKKVDMKSKVKTGKKQETPKTRITKGTIGMTGSF